MDWQQQHIVREYDEELMRLQGEILRMGGIAEDQLQKAFKALMDIDDRNAEKIIHADESIDMLELEISADVMHLLALRQPMASDLRTVLSSLRIASNIERIGDYAANIAKRSLAISSSRPREAFAPLPKWALTPATCCATSSMPSIAATPPPR
ncbi:MAG: hypothetical protein LBV36_02925 [Chromatiales bacterium]|jgi:phosphate transport system protein|nr:hypothetical protein [Chromatiales bacterium]